MKRLNEENLSVLDNMMMYPRKPVGEFEENQILKSVITGIALNKGLDSYITKKFRSRSSTYYRAACEHEWYSEITQSMCMVDQIERGLKVLGIWSVEGRKALDDFLMKGWPELWNSCERFKKDCDSTKIQDLLEREAGVYEICFQPEIILYYMFYFGMKELFFPLEGKKNSSTSEALFSSKREIDIEAKIDQDDVEEFCAFFGLYPDADNIDELMELSEALTDSVFSFFEFPLHISGINSFCLMHHSISRKEADLMSSRLKENHLHFKKLSFNEVLEVFYFSGYLLAIIGKEYDALKSQYFKEKEKTQKLLDAKAVSGDEKKIIKEFEKLQVYADKIKNDNIRMQEELNNLEALLRKVEAERDSEIKKAAKENKAKFHLKEAEYQNRIKMLEEMLAGQIKEDIEEISSVSFKEMLTLIRETAGILFVCGNATHHGTKKIRKLKQLAGNIKFFSSENDPIPSDISYIFFDYHLISHGVYYKIKNIGKRNGIPIYNIENLNAEKNIAEMYYVINKKG